MFFYGKPGAEVIAYDLSEHYSWDIVPFADTEEYEDMRKSHIKKINNAFWFNHQRFNSQAKMVYGTVYSVPEEIGPVDIVTFGSVLLHVRDPFLAIESACKMAKEMVIITETEPLDEHTLSGPSMRFLPNPHTGILFGDMVDFHPGCSNKIYPGSWFYPDRGKTSYAKISGEKP